MDVRVARRTELPQLRSMLGMHDRLVTEATRAGDCYVAEDDSELLGVIVLEHSFYAYGFISLLYVREDHRREGVASELMTHTEQLCTTAKLFTSTNESNQPMRRLCESLGYIASGVIYNLDEDDPELVYMKRVHNASEQPSADSDAQARSR